MELSGIEITPSRRSIRMSALALYPARMNTSSGIFAAALISNMMTPFSSVPFGAMYSSVASSEMSCRAPIVSLTGIPSRMRPTSVSSTFPRKIMLFMSATDAMVVPSLKLLDRMTELPTLIGTSRTIPVMVERICVLLSSAFRLAMPFCTISRLSCAFCSSSLALEYSVSFFSNSSLATTPESNNPLTRSNSCLV